MSRRVLRRAEWAWPSRPVHLEVVSAQATGDKPPLLFVHDLGHGAWCFGPWQQAAAERGWSSHALSLRGHGGSGGQNELGRTTLRDYEHDVLQVIAGLSDVPVLVGHSLGALVVQRVLRRYPARAGVLLTPIPASGAPSTMRALARHRPGEFARATVGGTIRLRAEDLFAQLPERQARAYASRIGRESRWAQYAMLFPERLGPVDCPVLVVGADQDKLVAAPDVRRCALELAAEVRWAPGGHDLMLDGPRDEALALVLDWLDEHCPPGPPLSGARLTKPLHLD